MGIRERGEECEDMGVWAYAPLVSGHLLDYSFLGLEIWGSGYCSNLKSPGGNWCIQFSTNG
jgi:hypothetical protein